MVTSIVLYLAFLALLCGERLAELWLSGRNVRRALAAGGTEIGRAHYRVMVVVHAMLPAACAAEVIGLHRPFPGLLGWVALGVAIAAQVVRWWAVSSLGWRWNTRVLVVPGAPVVDRGPYRFVRHPNYVAVALEVAAVPLVHGAWLTAALFSLANAALLAVRIPAEERAMGEVWARAFAGRPRFLPGVRRA